MISDLANSKPGVVEKVLYDLHGILLAKKEDDRKPKIELSLNSDLDEEIEKAKETTDRKVLIAKREECEQQAEEINQLNERIAKLKALIQEKDKKLAELGAN